MEVWILQLINPSAPYLPNFTSFKKVATVFACFCKTSFPNFYDQSWPKKRSCHFPISEVTITIPTMHPDPFPIYNNHPLSSPTRHFLSFQKTHQPWPPTIPSSATTSSKSLHYVCMSHPRTANQRRPIVVVTGIDVGRVLQQQLNQGGETWPQLRGGFETWNSEATQDMMLKGSWWW